LAFTSPFGGHRVFDYADNACDDGACYAAADGLAFLNT